MPPHDDEAECQRRGEDQADRTPNPRPEDGSHNDGHGRQSGGMAVEKWLHYIPGERFDDHEQQRRVDCCPPAGIDRRRERQRGNGPQQRPDVRDEPKQSCQHPPERCGRHADHPESHSDHPTEASIHAQLRHEVSAEALARIVHRECRPVQIGGAKRRMNLSRRSSRCIRMKIATISTIMVVSRGPSTGSITARPTASTEDFGGASSTTSGCCCVPAGRAAVSVLSPRVETAGTATGAAAGLPPLRSLVIDVTRVVAKTWILSTLLWTAST